MIVTGKIAYATPCWLLGYLIVKVTPLNQRPPVLRAGLNLLLSFILASVFLPVLEDLEQLRLADGTAGGKLRSELSHLFTDRFGDGQNPVVEVP